MDHLCRNRSCVNPDHIDMTALYLERFMNYGITADEYDAAMLGAACAICGSNTDMVMDHNHSTGAVREPLCSKCNWAIGLFYDNPDTLRAAARYLEKHGA